MGRTDLRTLLRGLVCVALMLATSAAWALDLQSLEARDGTEFDLFGLPVALQGDLALVAAKGADGAASGSGAVYPYLLKDGRWVQGRRVVASDGDVNDEFGTAIALDAGLAVVTAPRDDDLGNESGAAYVFRASATGWVEEQKLVASDGRDLLFFGGSVALDDGVIAVGAPSLTGDEPGSVYVFRHQGGRWLEEQILGAADGLAGDFFGSSGLAIEGDHLLVAAERHAHGSGSGAVYSFRYDGSVWRQETEINPQTGIPAQFGRAIAVEGQLLVVGAPSAFAPYEDGIVYVFREESGRWTQIQELQPSDPSDQFPWDGFGNALDISCGTIFVASPYHCHDGPCPGSVYVYRRRGQLWTEERELVPATGPVAYDFFGQSVKASGGRVLIGAPGTNTEAGPDAGLVYALFAGVTAGLASVDDCGTSLFAAPRRLSR